MTRTRHRSVLLLFAAAGVLVGVLAGCRPPEPAPETGAVEIEAPEIIGGTDTVYAAIERRTLPPSRIYYTLTDHAWYAHGEPLLHDGAAFHASGLPVPASLDDMERVGDYHGVDYYARAGADDGVVFVPVFEGYWQPFRRDTTQRAGN